MTTTELELLQYHGRAMDPKPINTTVRRLAEGLAAGQTLVAQLEPGDGTFYGLLVSPAWSPYLERELGRFGVPQRSARDFLIVTYLRDSGGEQFFATDRVEGFDLPTRNEWTRTLLAWWLRGLWREIENVRAGR